MSRTSVLSEVSRRRWRPQITLAHLAWLILGLAILFGVVRPYLNYPLTTADSVVSLLDGIAYRMATTALLLAQATVVLALARHALRGGYPQPAEWLALALVLSWPAYPVRGLNDAFWIGLHSLTVHPIEIGGIIYSPRATISLFLTLVGCLAFTVARRVIPARARTPITFILALLLVWGAIPSILAEFSPMVGSISVPWLGRLAASSRISPSTAS